MIDKALKDFATVEHLTAFDNHHNTIDDLCFLCLHELDLHAEGEYQHTLKDRKALLKFCKTWGPAAVGSSLDYAAEAQKVFNTK